MTGRGSRNWPAHRHANRRQFFKLLAASPLLGLAASGLPASWQEALARESRRLPAGARSTIRRCADCGAEMGMPSMGAGGQGLQDPVLPPQNAQEDQLTGQIVETPDDAINVWDFERVAHANNLAQHWDYLHMGVDDYETRRANREGFQRLI